MRPETWAPTCTVTRAESVPEAVTLETIGPRSTGDVTKVGGCGRCACQYQPPATAKSTSPAAVERQGNCQRSGGASRSGMSSSFAPGTGVAGVAGKMIGGDSLGCMGKPHSSSRGLAAHDPEHGTPNSGGHQ